MALQVSDKYASVVPQNKYIDVVPQNKYADVVPNPAHLPGAGFLCRESYLPQGRDLIPLPFSLGMLPGVMSRKSGKDERGGRGDDPSWGRVQSLCGCGYENQGGGDARILYSISGTVLDADGSSRQAALMARR